MALPTKSLAAYSLLALPLAFLGMPLYIHAPDFYATDQGLSLATIAAIILAVRIFDAVQDPVIGYLSDKYAASRPYWMAFFMALMTAGFILLFHPFGESKAAWFAVMLLVTTTAFSVLTINFNALGSLWSQDPRDKTRITSWREVVGLLGLLVAVALPPILALMVARDHVFSLYAMVLCVFMAIGAAGYYRWRVLSAMPDKPLGQIIPGFDLRGMMHGDRGQFFALFGVSMLASSMPAVLVMFFIRDKLEAESFAGLFLFLYLLAGAAGIPFWRWLSDKISAHKAWFISMLVAIISFIWAFFLGAGDVWAYGIICITSGLALGAELCLPPAILSKMIDDDGRQDETARAFSVMAFLGKMSLALASGISLYALSFTGFESGKDNSADALLTLSLFYAAIPCVIKGFAAMFLYWHMKERSTERGHHEQNKPTFSAGGRHDS